MVVSKGQGSEYEGPNLDEKVKRGFSKGMAKELRLVADRMMWKGSTMVMANNDKNEKEKKIETCKISRLCNWQKCGISWKKNKIY